MPTEADLLQHARQLDRQTLAMIYDQYSPGLFRYAARLLGDREKAEECVSETFVRFFQQLKVGRGPRDYLQAYLYRIAHNLIVDYYRHNHPLADLDEQLPDDSAPVEVTAIHLVRENILRAAVQKLSPDQQMVITLKYFEGWAIEDVALALGRPANAVKAVQHRALVKLRQILPALDKL